jgi:hypothetical protein
VLNGAVLAAGEPEPVDDALLGIDDQHSSTWWAA